MYNFLTKNGLLIAFGVGLLITIAFYAIAIPGVANSGVADADAQEQIKVLGQTGMFDMGLKGSIFLIIVAALAWLVFGLIGVGKDIKGSIKGIAAVVVMVVAYFVFKGMAVAPETGRIRGVMDTMGVSDDQYGFSVALMNLTFVLLAIAVLVLIVSEVRNFFK